jgi:N6-adenosine-specific RNA methylase IME4
MTTPATDTAAIRAEYEVIYADPPWWYSNRSANRKTKFGGGARAHYDVMRDSEVLAMADFVKDLSADNCVLFLWATGPRLDFAIETLKAWGFRYSTVGFVWEKITKRGGTAYGPGFYTSSNCEVVLIGSKKAQRPARRMLPQVARYPRMKHSEKPEIIRERIELMYPVAKKIELFARCERPGWDAWGNQVGIIPEQTKIRLEAC